MERCRGKITFVLVCAMLITMLFTGCSQKAEETVDLNSLTVEQLVEGAKKEGRIDTVGMPDNWANWKQTWDDLNELYGLDHSDIDISSAEEIAMFEAEKNSPTKDLGDVGQAMGRVAVEKGVVQPYKTSYWDEIPEWAKDEEGNWMVAYLGTIGFITNTALVDDAPTSWEDIRNGDYKVTVSDVTKASQSQAAVIASAYAFGGDLNNLEPAFEFWREMAAAGRIDKGNHDMGRLEAGEVEVACKWDYNVLMDRDALQESHPETVFQCNIPTDGSVQLGYATIINKYAPHPHAAALAREYIFSDKGQQNLAEGYATPIRDVELSEDLIARRIPAEQYVNAHPVANMDEWDAATAKVAEFWTDEIIPMLN